MTYSSLKVVQRSCSRRKTPQAAMAGSHKVGCRWESSCAGTQDSLLLCLPCGSRTWCDDLAVRKAGFLICPCLCVTAVCYHICDGVPSGGLSTAQQAQCWHQPGTAGHPGLCLIPALPPQLLCAGLLMVTSFVCLLRVWALWAWLSLVFVQCPGCHGCKWSQRVINHLGIVPHLFLTKVTGRSAHAGPGREWMRCPGWMPWWRLQHPALALVLWIFFCPEPQQHPHSRGTFPTPLGQMCLCCLPEAFPKDWLEEGLWQGMAAQWAGRESWDPGLLLSLCRTLLLPPFLKSR